MTPADYATAAAIAVLGAWSWIKATEAGKDEAEQIARNIALNINEDLPHDELLMQRIGDIGGVWVALWMFLGAIMVIALKSHWSDGVLIGIPLAGVAWAVFTMRHRYALNRARGFDWRYTAPGNRYDWMFIQHTLGWINRRNYRERVRESHALNYGSPACPGYTKAIHRAGLLAYAFEMLVAAGAVVVAIWIA